MKIDELPLHLAKFLDQHIDSIEQLQVLFLLSSQPTREWPVSEITAELRSADSAISKRLDDLYSRKVIIRVPELKDRHKYCPVSEEIRSVVEELAQYYQYRPYKVIDAIYQRPSSYLRAFADAFKFGGEKE